MYHPELFPELALNNPQPTNFEIPKSKENRRKKNKSQLKASIKEVPERDDINLSMMNSEIFKEHRGYAYEKYDP